MRQFRVLYHIMRADFLERVRRYSFLIMLLFTVFVTYFFIPAQNAPIYPILVLGKDFPRPIYNSAWIGTMTTLLMTEFFLLFAFYLLKGAIERDLHTGVGQIIATTPISRLQYTLGKWLSNLALVTTMVLVIIAASGALQFLRGEELQLDLGALALPFLIVLLPALAFIAAISVLFDCVKWLRGGLGNLVFFFGVYPTLVLSTDLQGINVLYPSIFRACSAYFSSCTSARQVDLESIPLSTFPTFQYMGVTWTTDIILERFAWIIAAVAVVVLAAFLHRFDPDKLDTDKLGHRFGLGWRGLFSSFAEQPQFGQPETGRSEHPPLPVRLTPLPVDFRAHPSGIHFKAMLLAEIHLAFKGIGWWWRLVAIGLVAASFFMQVEEAHFFLLPLAWLWPLVLWSAMGVREVRYHTDPIVFSGPYLLRRQFGTSWLVGVLVAFLMASGIMFRLAGAGEWTSLAAISVGAMFVPTLAMTMGCWSGESKLFEGTYLFVWYLASVHSVPYLDFMGRFPEMIALGIPWIYAGLTALLWGAALWGRQRQLCE